jgi:ApbE superfamily uncharacterized protein (UPF0280 family)
MYQPRFYRSWIKNQDLVHFNVIVEESDCSISAVANLAAKARSAIVKYRSMIKKYIASHPEFLTTLEPYTAEKNAPGIIIQMARYSAACGVGPMASVAGAIAQFTAGDLRKYSPELIIENGGDIYLESRQERLLGIFAGNSPLSGKLALALPPCSAPLGISTSSGTVGHSLSFGKADAVVILAENAILSDAAATAVGNLIITSEDIPLGIEKVRSITGLKGVVIIKDEKLGVWGEVTLKSVNLDF